MNNTIYALVHPITNEIRYVGKTSKTVENRIKGHIACCDIKSHKNNWVKNLIKSGLKPDYVILEMTDSWVEAEQFWIAYFNFLGARLTNSTIGGEGSIFIGGSLLKIRKILRERNKSLKQKQAVSTKLKGRIITEEQREAISKKLTGTKASEETKLKLSIIQTKLAKDPIIRQKRIDGLTSGRKSPCSEAKKEHLSKVLKGKEPPNKGKPMSEEQKIKLSLIAKGKPGHKHSEEHKQYMSNIMKDRVFTEEHKQKLREAAKNKKLTDEHKANIKKSWERRKSGLSS